MGDFLGRFGSGLSGRCLDWLVMCSAAPVTPAHVSLHALFRVVFLLQRSCCRDL